MCGRLTYASLPATSPYLAGVVGRLACHLGPAVCPCLPYHTWQVWMAGSHATAGGRLICSLDTHGRCKWAADLLPYHTPVTLPYMAGAGGRLTCCFAIHRRCGWQAPTTLLCLLYLAGVGSRLAGYLALLAGAGSRLTSTSLLGSRQRAGVPRLASGRCTSGS